MPQVDPKKNNMEMLFPEFGPMRIKYKDIFDMKEFYDAVHEWILEHDYAAYDGDLEMWETYYGERVSQSGAKEIWIRWRIKKGAPDSPTFIISGKKNPAIVYHMDLDFHCVALTKAEVVKEGRKMKVHKGEVELHIRPYVEEAYLKHFSKNIFLKQIQNIFQKRIYRKKFEERKKELYKESYALNNFIKQWFKLKRYLPYEESKNFFPSYAWPSHLREDK
jgi:hypothetical protein